MHMTGPAAMSAAGPITPDTILPVNSGTTGGTGPTVGRVEARPHTLVNAATEEILRLVTSGALRVGDRLPPERVLIGELGVSRTVLREALSSLEALGVIEARSTRGRFVAARGSDGRSRMLVNAWLNQHANEIEETMRVRAVVERQAIMDIAEQELTSLLHDLRRIIGEQRQAIDAGDFLAAAQANQNFHLTLCSRTPNRLLRSLATGLIDHSRRAAVAIYSDRDGALASLEEHEAIADALARGDRAAAANLDAEHQLTPLRRRRATAQQAPDPA
jgi:GntR family transcriptional repressor for pyruvate dehydrogenase complex